MSEETRWPRLYRVTRRFPGTPVADIAAATREALGALHLESRVKSGQRVVITAGSRGVANIVAATAAAVAEVRRLGAEPIVIPAMGSHGGGTPEGQLAVLSSYGFTPDAVGAPVISQGEVVGLGNTEGGVPLFADRLAAEADGILVINRVKPHTDFTGELESGPNKMLAIGLGKKHSASTCHSWFCERGYDAVLREVGAALWQRLPMLGALGLVENGHHETVRIGAVRPASPHADEAELLAESRKVFGYLPYERLDVLVVDRLGKDISGSGMDPNVTGSDGCKLHGRRQTPFIWRICVRNLSAATHGNATGIGNADYALRRCVDQVDWAATYTNTVAAASPEGARCPVVFDTDAAMLEAAFRTSGPRPPAGKRLVWIRDTLRVDDILVSEALLDELRDELVTSISPYESGLDLDHDGFLGNPWA
ncbi:MAG: DUF2088 domain-containing protein [Armatimonadetes bacterium]|nr:DUF2088 domain-containing protein [Armatimonadota bacterium]